MDVSTVVCALGWCSAFVLAWAWIFGVVKVDLLTVLLWLFFVVVGTVAGIMFQLPTLPTRKK